MRWIDSHVHLFSENNCDNSGIPLVYGRNLLNTPDLYFDILADKKPEGVVVVDFSKAKDSEHVIKSLDELKAKNIKGAGVIKANLNDARTWEWVKRDDVKGIRLYSIADIPDISGEKWQEMFDILRAGNKHILVFGVGANLLALVKQLPKDITLLIDHLGMPDISSDDKNFNTLLEYAKERGNIYFKGPGYRTSVEIASTAPVAKKIAASLGVNRLILGASDAPFAGPVSDRDTKYAGKQFCEVMDYPKVINFVEELAKNISNDDKDIERMLYSNAKDIYGF